MMKKIPVVFIMAAILLLSSIGSSVAVQAQVSQAEKSTMTFDELGYIEKLLMGPFDVTTMYFSLPVTWDLVEGGTISLTYTHFLSGGGEAPHLDNNPNWIGGSLLVFYNGQLVDTILLDGVGQKTKVIAIDEDAYRTNSDDGRSDIRLFLDASTTCDYEVVQSSVIVHGASFVDFAYDLVRPPVDLSLFPRPIYQPSSFSPNKATIVIPDSPTDAELEAALSVSAGIGSVSEGNLSLTVIQAKDLTETIQRENHIIFVGLAQKFPQLSGITLPAKITSQGVDVAFAEEDDGFVQVAQSPWDQGHVIYVVSGNTEPALVKAAQAFSTGKLIVSGRKDLSIIAATSPVVEHEVVNEDFTLGDLGYESFTLGGFEGNYADFSFYVSADQVLAEDAYIELLTSHSGLLDAERAGMTVLLNDEIVGGIGFLGEGNEISSEKLEILPKVLRRGKNNLVMFSDLFPFDNCFAPEITSTWVNVSEDSTFHLPISSTSYQIGNRLDLNNYPNIFLEGETLEDLAVIVAKDDFVSWESAFQIVNELGAISSLSMANLKVAYADEVPEEILTEKNLLVLGKASTLPIISDLNSFLPAPFTEGSDEAVQPTFLVNYRVLPETSVGYLQLLPSPWNADKVILTVMGNVDAGIPLAADALSTDNLRSQLLGNFSILYGTQVLATDTRLGPSKEGLVAELPAEAITVSDAEAPSAEESAASEDVNSRTEVEGTPKWIVPVFVFSSLIIILLLVFVLRRESATRIGDEKEAEEDRQEELPD